MATSTFFCVAIIVLIYTTSFEMFAFQDIQPVIKVKDLNEGHSVIGGTMRLECRTTLNSSYISINWFYADGPLNPFFSKQDDLSGLTNSSYITVSTMTREAVDIYDRGFYTCQAVHKEKSKYDFKEKLQLLVWDKDSGMISINGVDQFRNAALELAVYIRAHPNITSVIWVHNGNETVITNPPSAFPIENESPNKQSNYYVRFPFETLTVENFGEYSVTVMNDWDTQTRSFFVDLSNKTIINLTYENVDENTMFSTFRCEVVSFPKKTVTWIFKKNNATDDDFFVFLNDLTRKDNTDGTTVVESRFEENGLKVTSYVSINLNETGFLECRVGSSSKRLDIFFVQNGFDILAKDRVKSNNGSNDTIYVGYRKTVTIGCVVSLFNYTKELSWSNDIYDLPYQNFHVKTYLAAKTLNYIIIQEMNFTCEVSSRKGEIESKTVTVIPKKIPNLHPHIIIEDTKKGHTVEGELLNLTCTVLYYTTLEIDWYFLNGTWQHLDAGKIIGNELDVIDSYKYFSTSRYLTRGNLSKGGFYRCTAKTYYQTFLKKIWVPVYGANATVIKFDDKASIFDKKNKKIRVFIDVHPKPTIQWFDNQGEVIPTSFTSTEYTSESGQNNYMTTVTFEEINLRKNGKYTVVVANGYHNESFSVVVNVTGIPTSNMEVHELDEENMTSVIKCTSIGYPEPQISWYFQKCVTLESCVDVNKINENHYIEMKELRHEIHGLEAISYFSVNISEPGILRCLSKNSQGKNYTDEPIIYVKNKFDVFAKNAFNNGTFVKWVKMLSGEKIKILCAVSIRRYVQSVEWSSGLYDEVMMEDTVYQHNYKFLLSFISVLDVTLTEDSQQYTCRVATVDGWIRSQPIVLKKRVKENIVIQRTNMRNKSVEINLGGKWNFECIVKGFPTPVIAWLKDNRTLRESEKIKIFNDNQELEIDDIQLEDEGEYTCQVSNSFGIQSVNQALTIRKLFQWIYVAVPAVVLAFLAVATVLWLYVKVRKENELLSELKAADLAYFEEGNLGNLNPDLGIEEQADLLPYDNKWEIPFAKIKLDKQLGSGAFGIVFKAEVTSYFSDEHQKIVAVKTVNPTSGFESVKNLASELKIMSHLGKHVNVVNLLGACTKNMIKKQLYVVVEYCAFGNLRDYIRRRGQIFVDQKHSGTNEFDWTIEVDDNSISDRINIDQVENTVRYSESSEFMYSKDFVIWAFQVCRGMEYLSSRRIVHGDLAARNVLLTNDNVVKVSDFGLAKKMYQDYNYVKSGKVPLPVKWMAVESIEKGIFSIQSDIWSFGVVLWEFFSLGGTPYPGMILDERFYKKLVGGYRMEPPQTATTSIYKIMMNCWNVDPLLRPSFTKLAEETGSMLDEPTRNYYNNMNNGYVLMSGRSDQEDYLTMVSPPTFENIAGSSGRSMGHGYVNASYVPG